MRTNENNLHVIIDDYVEKLWKRNPTGFYQVNPKIIQVEEKPSIDKKMLYEQKEHTIPEHSVQTVVLQTHVVKTKHGRSQSEMGFRKINGKTYFFSNVQIQGNPIPEKPTKKSFFCCS